MLDEASSRLIPTILLIDDDLAVRESLALLLESHGYHVVTAPDGKRGLTAFREHAPAVVVTDIMMPEQDGSGAIRELRRLDPAVKVIAISGGGKVDKSDYLTIAEKHGAHAAVEKVDLANLLDILPALINR